MATSSARTSLCAHAELSMPCIVGRLPDEAASVDRSYLDRGIPSRTRLSQGASQGSPAVHSPEIRGKKQMHKRRARRERPRID